MSMDEDRADAVEALVQGPRGCRLLLEFVLASERQRNLDGDEEPFNSAKSCWLRLPRSLRGIASLYR